MRHTRFIKPCGSLVALGLACPAMGGVLTWTGAGDGVSVFQEANWDLDGGGAPAAGTVDPGVNNDPSTDINHDVVVGDLGLPQNPGGGGGISGPFQLGPTGSLTITDNFFNGGLQGIRRDGEQAPAIDSGDNRPVVISNTGSAWFQFLLEIDATLDDNASLTLNGGGNPVNWSTINFLGSNTILTFNNELVADVVNEHLAKLFVEGVAAIVGADPSVVEPGDNLLIVSDGSVGAIVTPIIVGFDPADLDQDGDVDDADFGIAFAAFTGPNAGPSSNPAADLDGDGDVDDADFGIAFAAFTGPGGGAAVPEPTSLALIGLGGFFAVLRRRAC